MGIMAIVAVMGITYCYVKAKKHEPFMPAIISLVVFLATCNLSVKTSEGEVVNGVINMELLSGKGMVAAIIILITMFIYIFFKNIMNTTFIDFIYQLLQIPLQRVSDSLLGILFITMMISFLWWFGINGSAIVNSVVSSIIAANTLDIIPSLFNINEPVLFGIPIVMNSFLLFPFMIIPIIAVLITYFSIASGLISPFSGVMVPWTTPPILSGFFIGGWKAALLQLVIMIISIVIYYPFFKMQESFRLKVNNEQKVVNALG